jgi:hypothetical protein
MGVSLREGLKGDATEVNCVLRTSECERACNIKTPYQRLLFGKRPAFKGRLRTVDTQTSNGSMRGWFARTSCSLRSVSNAADGTTAAKVLAKDCNHVIIAY